MFIARYKIMKVLSYVYKFIKNDFKNNFFTFKFLQITVGALIKDDLNFILTQQFQQLPADLIKTMVEFNSKLASEAGVAWGHAGSPWEMNLRDITRWCETMIKAASNNLCGNKQYFNPGDTVELIYVNRMRTSADRQNVS